MMGVQFQALKEGCHKHWAGAFARFSFIALIVLHSLALLEVLPKRVTRPGVLHPVGVLSADLD